MLALVLKHYSIFQIQINKHKSKNKKKSKYALVVGMEEFNCMKFNNNNNNKLN